MTPVISHTERTDRLQSCLRILQTLVRQSQHIQTVEEELLESAEEASVVNERVQGLLDGLEQMKVSLNANLTGISSRHKATAYANHPSTNYIDLLNTEQGYALLQPSEGSWADIFSEGDTVSLSQCAAPANDGLYTVLLVGSTPPDGESEEILSQNSFDASSDWQTPTGWAISGGAATHTGGAGTGALEQLKADMLGAWPATLVGAFFLGGITITRTVGTLTIECGSSFADVVLNATGTYLFLVQSDDTSFKMTPSNDFNGSVSWVSLKRVRGLILAQAVTTADTWDTSCQVTVVGSA